MEYLSDAARAKLVKLIGRLEKEAQSLAPGARSRFAGMFRQSAAATATATTPPRAPVTGKQATLINQLMRVMKEVRALVQE